MITSMNEAPQADAIGRQGAAPTESCGKHNKSWRRVHDVREGYCHTCRAEFESGFCDGLLPNVREGKGGR